MSKFSDLDDNIDLDPRVKMLKLRGDNPQTFPPT